MSGVLVSHFNSVKQKIPAGSVTVATWLESIRDGRMAQTVTAVRAAAASSEEYDALKDRVCATSWAGPFPNGRKGNVPDPASGLVFADLDNHDGKRPTGWLESERARLSALESVVAVYVSIGGNGLHIVTAVSPTPTTRPSYKQAWEAVNQHLNIPESVDKKAKDITRLALVSYDPAIYINFLPTPLLVEEEDQASQRDPLEGLPVPEDYNVWVSWVITLKTCGFTVEEVEAWSSKGEKHQPGEVRSRWDGLPLGNSTREWRRFLKAAPPGAGASTDVDLPWLRRFSGIRSVVINGSIVNVEIALTALGFGDAWRYDEWNKRHEWSPDGAAGEEWTPVTDASLLTLKHSIEQRFGSLPISFTPTLQAVRSSVEFQAQNNSYNRQVAAFRQKEWDGR